MNPNIKSFRVNLSYAVSRGLTRGDYYESLHRAQEQYLLDNHALDGRIWTYDKMPEKFMTEILDAIKENPLDEKKDYESIFKWALRMNGEQIRQLAQTLIAKYTPAGGAGGAGPIRAPQPIVPDVDDELKKAQAELGEAVTKTFEAEQAAKEARAHELMVRDKFHDAMKAVAERDRKRKRDQA